MLIAIISDTHDNLSNLEKFLNWAKKNKIEMIIHCGDIASSETIRYLAQNFNGPLHLVYGNMDEPRRDEIYEAIDGLKNVTLHGDIGEIVVETHNYASLRIAFCHFPEKAKALAESGKYNLVFYGHTHKPWMETRENNCQLINPGTLAGLFSKATFAVYDTKSGKLELKVLEFI